MCGTIDDVRRCESIVMMGHRHVYIVCEMAAWIRHSKRAHNGRTDWRPESNGMMIIVLVLFRISQMENTTIYRN